MQGVRSAVEMRLINENRAARRLLADLEALARLATDALGKRTDRSEPVCISSARL